MKKLLALVLALVMVMGLATVSASASAKTFADDADITYKEAVDVLSGVGVLSGMGENKFAPKEELTRAQAAKIIAYLDLGETAAENLPASKTFSDVPAEHWASKYIAYCYSAGIVGGVGGGKFDPDGKLTGYAFGKMLLVVLGYDTKIEGFSGNDWMINVASKMNTANIGDDVKKAGTLVLTREEAAEYALDALKADVVEYDNKGTTVNTSDGTSVVIGSSKASSIEYRNEANNYAGANADDDGYGAQQLLEKRYGTDLKFKAADDDFGRPTSGKWAYKNEDITDPVVASGDLVLNTTGKVTYGNMYSILGSKNANFANAGSNVNSIKVIVDGKTVAQYPMNTATTSDQRKAVAAMGILDPTLFDNKSSNTALAYYTATAAALATVAADNDFTAAELTALVKATANEPTSNGALTEVYKQETAVGGEYDYTIVVINTWLAQATEDYDTANEDISIELKEDWRSSDAGVDDKMTTPALNDSKLEVEDFAVIADLKEDDYVLLTIANGDVKSVAIPQIVKNVKVTVYKNYDSLTADGTSYSYSKKAAEIDEVKVNDEYDVILDNVGRVIGVEATDANKTVSDYVFISEANDATFDVQAKLVFMSDGSKKTVTVDKINSEDAKHVYTGAAEVRYTGAGTITAGYVSTGNFATYKVNKDGSYKLEYVPTTKVANTYINYEENGVRAIEAIGVASTPAGNSKTVFVADGKVYTGIKNAPKTYTAAAYVNDATGVADVYYTLDGAYLEAVYTEAKGKLATKSDEIVYILKNGATDFAKGDDGDNTYYEVDAVVSGSKTSYKVSEDSYTAIVTNNGGKGLYVIDSYSDGDYPDLTKAGTDDNVVQPSGATARVRFSSYSNGTLNVLAQTAAQVAAEDADPTNIAGTADSCTLDDNVKIYTIDTTDSNKTSSISTGSIKSRANDGYISLLAVFSDDPAEGDSTVVTLYMVK